MSNDTRPRFGVVIGRFQPIHCGHLHNLIFPALAESDQLIILLGSSYGARTFRNPLTFAEREKMVRTCLDAAGVVKPVHIYGIRDTIYDDSAWVDAVALKVKEMILAQFDHPHDVRVTLYGVEKADTVAYLDDFPQWYRQTFNDADLTISGTAVREAMYKNDGGEAWTEMIPAAIQPTLKTWLASTQFADMCANWEYVQQYKKTIQVSPYPIIFQTVDNVVVWKHHLLLVRRRDNPGQGLWALPGGFIDAGEWLIESAVREMFEETSIRLQKEWLVSQRTYDAPNRSLRGRIITTIFQWRPPSQFDFNAHANTDAEHVRWVDLTTFFAEYGDKMFEDHFEMIQQEMMKGEV